MVPLDFLKAPQLATLRGALDKVTLNHRAKGHSCLRSPFRLFGLRIAAKMHLGQHVFRALARGKSVEVFDRAERHPALFCSDPILRDPSSLAAIAHPKAELLKPSSKNLVRRARGQFELLDGRRCQFRVIARDATEIEARERPAKKETNDKEDDPPPPDGARPTRKRGRPRKDEQRPKPEPTRLERQTTQNVDQMLADLPTACDVVAGPLRHDERDASPSDAALKRIGPPESPPRPNASFVIAAKSDKKHRGQS